MEPTSGVNPAVNHPPPQGRTNPDWLRRVSPAGHLEPLLALDRPQHSPRQKMPVTYRLNGGIYWVRTKLFVAQKTFLPARTAPFEMPVQRSIDIDDEQDLRIANWMSAELESVVGSQDCVTGLRVPAAAS